MTIALIDGNNFCVSCERVCQPANQRLCVIGQFSAGNSVKIVHPRPDQYSGNPYSPSAS
jgi:hypothetical protein